jgi:hypothetical protein
MCLARAEDDLVEEVGGIRLYAGRDLELVQPALGVVQAHRLDAAVGSCGCAKLLVQLLWHLHSQHAGSCHLVVQCSPSKIVCQDL